MTGKDVLKLLLVSYGFKKVKIATYRADYGCIGYQINAENDDGDIYADINCEGLMFNIAHIINTMSRKGIEADYNPFPGHDYPVEKILESENLESL